MRVRMTDSGSRNANQNICRFDLRKRDFDIFERFSDLNELDCSHHQNSSLVTGHSSLVFEFEQKITKKTKLFRQSEPGCLRFLLFIAFSSPFLSDTPISKGLKHHSTVITTFPRACPSSRYRIASGTSLNDLYVRSMTVCNFPDCTISARSVRSWLLGCAIIMPIFCLTKREYTAAFSALPSAPRKPCSFALPPPIIT